jgi:hypothetical protein
MEVELLRVIEQKQHHNGLFIVREVDINPPFQCSNNDVMDGVNVGTGLCLLYPAATHKDFLYVDSLKELAKRMTVCSCDGACSSQGIKLFVHQFDWKQQQILSRMAQ